MRQLLYYGNRNMFGKNVVTDKDLLRTVNQRLSRAGAASSTRVTVTIQQGNVTLTGNLQYPYQRAPIVKSVERITGVRRVIDQLRLVERSAN
jgi:osmotically-inducible protein OsmY